MRARRSMSCRTWSETQQETKTYVQQLSFLFCSFFGLLRYHPGHRPLPSSDISGYPSSIHRAQMSEGPSPARDARVVALIEQNVEKDHFARREGLSGPWKGPIRAGLAVAVVTRRTRVAIRNRLRRSKSGPVSPCRLSSHLPLPHDVLRPSVCVEGPVVLRLRLLF